MFDVKPLTSKAVVDCGPTCLTMLLHYYGIAADQEKITKECYVNLTGCTAKDLMRVGKAHGLQDMKAFQMDVDELIRQDRPAIVWYKFSHFVIMAGQDDKGNVVVCQPSMGRFPIDVESFSSFYSGVAIFNGDPEDLPEPPAQATVEDYESALGRLGVII